MSACFMGTVKMLRLNIEGKKHTWNYLKIRLSGRNPKLHSRAENKKCFGAEESDYIAFAKIDSCFPKGWLWHWARKTTGERLPSCLPQVPGVGWMLPVVLPKRAINDAACDYVFLGDSVGLLLLILPQNILLTGLTFVFTLFPSKSLLGQSQMVELENNRAI